jgi:hypothetical protein
VREADRVYPRRSPRAPHPIAHQCTRGHSRKATASAGGQRSMPHAQPPQRGPSAGLGAALWPRSADVVTLSGTFSLSTASSSHLMQSRPAMVTTSLPAPYPESARVHRAPRPPGRVRGRADPGVTARRCRTGCTTPRATEPLADAVGRRPAGCTVAVVRRVDDSATAAVSLAASTAHQPRVSFVS